MPRKDGLIFFIDFLHAFTMMAAFFYWIYDKDGLIFFAGETQGWISNSGKTSTLNNLISFFLLTEDLSGSVS